MDDKKEKNTGNRRRGEILEAAIVEAAWNELLDVGYNHLTMERVAIRAKTNKAVLYRRWPNKYDLVIAALKKYMPKNPHEIPNTGDLRDDVFTFLYEMVKPLLTTVGFQTLYGLIAEYRDKDNKNLLSLLPQILHSKTESKQGAAMMTILKNAEARNEIVLEKISPRVISLPMDLLRYEVITGQEAISEKTIAEIVDDVFMPLIRM